ncbi:cation:proton antiporter [Candidatus Woesearchaeota archaeon]|nr:cation:proton antiporter [Candidatus Woesearchaeota archaeon]
MAVETSLIILLVILFAGLAIPELFKKVRMPFVTSIILIGAILGPHGLKYVEFDPIVAFIGFLGMTFLMLMGGLETDIAMVNKHKKELALMACFNGAIPFIVGLLVTRTFGYSWAVSSIIGIIFVSSSVAILIPVLENIVKRKIGQLILAAVLILDISSLVLLSFVLQSINPITKLPLISYFIIISISIVALFVFVPKLTLYFFKTKFTERTRYERQLRFVIVLLIGVLVYFSVLGVHPILAAFLVGITLSKVVKSERILTKLRTMGYGLFVPVFFFVVGMEMDLSLFKGFNVIVISIVVSLILSKLFSGWLGARVAGLSSKESLLFGSSSIVQLTTTLAVTYVAASQNLLDNVLVTSIIALSIVTTILGPMLMKYLVDRYF